MMNIGIIGAGDIGRVYADLWYKAGHSVFLSSRNPQQHIGFVEALGDRALVGSVEEAAAFGDVILLAVNYGSVDSALDAIRPHVGGKIVIDATNPLSHTPDGNLKRLINDHEIAAEVIAAKLPDAVVTKAFTTLWTGHVENKANAANPTVAMPFAADDTQAQVSVAGLIADAGLDPVFIGSLAESAPLDPGSSVWNVVLTRDELVQRVAAFRSQQAA